MTHFTTLQISRVGTWTACLLAHSLFIIISVGVCSNIRGWFTLYCGLLYCYVIIINTYIIWLQGIIIGTLLNLMGTIATHSSQDTIHPLWTVVEQA